MYSAVCLMLHFLGRLSHFRGNPVEEDWSK